MSQKKGSILGFLVATIIVVAMLAIGYELISESVDKWDFILK